jgi:hypothetical protein
MDILTKIEELSNKGLAINYDIIDQKEIGTLEYKPDTQLKTYTVRICEISTAGHDPIEIESFDSLKEGLEYFIKCADEFLKDWDSNVVGCGNSDYDGPCKTCDYRNLRHRCYSSRGVNKFELIKNEE